MKSAVTFTKQWMTWIKIFFLLIAGILIINYSYIYYNKIYNNNCYVQCADYHLSGEAAYWDFVDYVIDNDDTIWIDKECYNDWCICIDECKAGLCCELLE